MEPSSSPTRVREQRFRELYDASYGDLLRFVARRVHRSHAEDIVGDVMLVAWRRLDDVPAELSDARAWLHGVARKTLQNSRRREERHDAVAVRLGEVHRGEEHDRTDAELVMSRVDVSAAWRRLPATDQEALALSVLDGLTAPEAARVLGISSAAFRLRLSRARRALRRHLNATPFDHLPSHPAPERSAQ
ncbi:MULTISPECIES: RNA polymerase sigma factor [unclassified Nocardioides]|uniref:RNA polymerase sigma factor n=1 Tax=unclassified Nocardioides TaxID=2615069 RepID=UPI0019110F8A|nr:MULTISPECIES: sigma-70 family RNA polymerase sigma factor [unclassified Nocardioides]